MGVFKKNWNRANLQIFNSAQLATSIIQLIEAHTAI